MFADRHGGDVKRMEALVLSGNRAEARALAHGLKGVAATLGANRVSALAARLEAALQQGATNPEWSELVAQCDRETEQLVVAIRALPEETPITMTDAEAVDLERLAAVLTDLESLLATGNIRASSLARDSEDLLRPYLGSHHGDFFHCIGVFDYENALSILQMKEISLSSASCD
jgi:HPt (histidine-containing phosphotransfer) domain-containing protein